MAVSRRPQVELVTECLKCVDSRPGCDKPGIKEGKGEFDSIIAIFVEVDSAVFNKNK